MRQFLGSLLAATLLISGCSVQKSEKQGESNGAVTHARLLAANQDADNWLTVGRTYDEQRYSPLEQISDQNVGKLGLAWYSDLDTARGQEATPLVIDGVLYVSTAWSLVKAYDGATGKLLWTYDPKVPRETLVRACCDAVNRGLAAWGNLLYIGTLDGRLIAIERKTGTPMWSVDTTEKDKVYTITGAPRVIDGKVIIGNGGAEYIARGYISAYDATTGKRVWRFHTVPGDPSQPFEQPALAQAARTWTGEWWKYGGGGTVWDAIAYDPDLDLLYFGTANGGPWNASVRSPQGGDNLFTSSIVAVRSKTGEYVWHFQETPGDRWDFDSTQHIMLATLPVNGQLRRVVLHAPKNGFFYMLDAATGKFLSAKPFVRAINWTRDIDPVTGRPSPIPAAFYDKTGTPFISLPGAAGAHSWQPMSFSPKTGLVYIPVNEVSFPYAAAGPDWKPAELGYNTAMDAGKTAMPADIRQRGMARAGSTGALVAWDPVAQKTRWRVDYVGPWNGGSLSTAGNLVFEGTANGNFIAYSADKGQKLWWMPVQSGVMAAPMTYSINGVQYVAVMAGWGGVWDVATGVLADKSGPIRNISRLLVFKLGGTAQLPAAPPPPTRLPLDPPKLTGSPQQVEQGKALFARFCSVCHGDAAVSGALNPDLRYSATLENANTWRIIVIDGVLKEGGMVSWAPVMTSQEADNIRHYVTARAHEDAALAKQP